MQPASPLRRARAIEPDPTAIGEVTAPPFVRLPDPAALFAARSLRLRALAESSELGPYLQFLAALSECQHRVQAGLPEPHVLVSGAHARSREHGMPPLSHSHGMIDAGLGGTIDRLLALAGEIDMRATARAALVRVQGADVGARADMVRAILADL